MWWHHLLGYFFSMLVGRFMISLVLRTLYLGLGWKPNEKNDRLHPHPEHPAMVGVLERALYTASWQLGKPEFIGVWLVLKVAGQWKGWSEDVIIPERTVLGRAIFNVFLIGNGFSMGYAIVGALMIDWMSQGEYIPAVTVPLSVLVTSLVFWFWAKCHVA